MIRTQIQITEDQAHKLRSLAHDREASVASLVREAIDRFLRDEPSLSWEDRKRRAIEAVGSFHGPPDLAERHDEYFVASYLGEDAEQRDDPR